jgi:hypothetical protein
MEELMEPDVVSKVGISIQADGPTIGCATPIHITSEDMNDAMLNFFCDFVQRHVVFTSSRAFDFKFLSIVLTEALKTLN